MTQNHFSKQLKNVKNRIMEKKNYDVVIPITGVLFFEIEAASEAEAITLAMGSDVTIKATGENLIDLEEWEMHDKIVKGNVFYGVSNTAEATEK